MNKTTMGIAESIQAGKATIHRTSAGTIWFHDKNGNTVVLQDPRESSRLWEAMRDGSGEPLQVVRVDATEKPSNVRAAGKSLLGNETRMQSAGGNWMFPHGDWQE